MPEIPVDRRKFIEGKLRDALYSPFFPVPSDNPEIFIRDLAVHIAAMQDDYAQVKVRQAIETVERIYAKPHEPNAYVLGELQKYVLSQLFLQ